MSSRPPLPTGRFALITVSIVDGHPSHASSLGQGLARFPGVVVFDRCQTLPQALSALGERPPRILLASDVVLGTEGWSWLAQLRLSKTTTQVIAISDNDQLPHVKSAFKAGACGYLLRQAPLAQVHQALYDVTSGGAPLSPTVARAIVSSFHTPSVEAAEGVLGDLTDRESEVLDLLSQGLRYRDIAIRMQLSPDTVHSHAKNVYRKLKVCSKTEAAMLWMRWRQGRLDTTSLAAVR